MPAGTAFVSTTGGGTQSGGEVSWSLATLAAGEVAQKQVVVIVNDALPAGTLLESEAIINGSREFLSTERRATAVAYIAPDTTLALSMNVGPQPALPGQMLDVELTVTNTTDTQIFGVQVDMIYPAGMLDVGEGAITGPFTDNCVGISCGAGENMIWNLGTLNPGQTVSLSFPVLVANATANGTVIQWKAMATQDNGDRVHSSFSGQVGESSAVVFLRGDPNADGAADISDALTILGLLFRGEPLSIECDKAADVVDDGTVDLTDAVRLLDFLFRGGLPLPAPFPACGEDPTPDELPCQRSASCAD